MEEEREDNHLGVPLGIVLWGRILEFSQPADLGIYGPNEFRLH